MKNKTTDELLDILKWISDRQKYRRSCGVVDGVSYSEECRMESDVLNELQARGFGKHF